MAHQDDVKPAIVPEPDPKPELPENPKDCYDNCRFLAIQQKAYSELQEKFDTEVKRLTKGGEQLKEQANKWVKSEVKKAQRRTASEFFFPNWMLLPFAKIPTRHQQWVMNLVFVLLIVAISAKLTLSFFGGTKVVKEHVLITPPGYVELVDFAQELEENDPTAVRLLMPDTRDAYHIAIDALTEAEEGGESGDDD